MNCPNCNSSKLEKSITGDREYIYCIDCGKVLDLPHCPKCGSSYLEEHSQVITHIQYICCAECGWTLYLPNYYLD